MHYTIACNESYILDINFDPFIEKIGILLESKS